MQSQQYIDYAEYNIWANNKFIASLSNVNEDLLNRKLESSFPSILKTISHIWMAEMGWLSRLEGNGWDTSEIDNFSGAAREMFTAWQTTSESFKKFVEKSDLEQKIDFEHKGVTFSIPFREIAHTVFNHGSYHRGQIVTLMRQLKIADIPKTDYIEWVREKAKGAY